MADTLDVEADTSGNPQLTLVRNGQVLGSEVSSFVIEVSEELSTVGGTRGAHSVLNPANWELSRNGVVVTRGVTSIAFGQSLTSTTLLNGNPPAEGSEVVVRCELPGMKREDISVKFTDDSTIAISGERKAVEKIERSDYLRHECSYGAFKRMVNLPEGCDHEKAKASFNDGVLEIRIPKSETTSKAWTVPIT